MRKQNIRIEEKEKAQSILKAKILHTIKDAGLVATEYQVEYLMQNPKAKLPTVLNHRETVRVYQLVINDYKKEIETLKKANEF